MKLVTSKDQCLFPYEVYEELVQKKLATKSFNKELNLTTFKYAKKVMFDRLWNAHPALMECRGVTFDATTKELKALPFRKSFNYLENNWWKGVSLDTLVYAAKKYNGFMGCISYDVVSTTGSTKSDFVGYVKEMVPQWQTVTSDDESYLVEVMHPSDPHIVQESIFCKGLGTRNHSTGKFHPIFYSGFYSRTLGEVLEDAKTDKGEGWMVYHPDDEFCLSPAKVKSDYYVGKKKLMRMTPKNVELMYRSPEHIALMLPERWKGYSKMLTELFTLEEWNTFTDQERRKEIENIEGIIA